MPTHSECCTIDVTDKSIELSNDLVRVKFDTLLGTISLVNTKKGTQIFSNGYILIHTGRGVLDSREMTYKAFSGLDFQEGNLRGKSVVIRTEDANKRNEMSIKLTVLEGVPGYSCVTRFGNLDEETEVSAIDSLVLDVMPNAPPSIGQDRSNLRYFRNGFQSWDLSQSVPVSEGRNTSHLYSIINNIETDEAYLIGYITSSNMFSTIQILGAKDDEEGIKQILASCNVDDISVTTRDSVVCEEMLFLTGGNCIRLTETYMDLLATKMDAIKWSNIPAGWCSWYFYYTMPDEQEIVDNTRFLADRFGDAMQWIQIDDGFQEAVGDWQENSRFASGLDELVEEIHRKGYQAGIWTAPFVASEHSDTFKDHPDWFIRDKNNLPIAVDQNPLWLGNYYAFDLTNPVVIEHIKKIFERMKEFGFEYFKIDFLYHAAYQGRRVNGNMTRAQAVRKGLRTIREIVGDDLILGCGAPLGVSIGITNMMRIGTDIATDWRYDWGGGVYECAINTITRSPMHDRLWVNDPDCILVRQEDNNLTIEEVKLWLSVVAVSGGAVLLSDRMMDVSEERLRMVDKLLPPYRKGGIPVDAHLYEEPRVFAVPVEGAIGYWSIVAVVNLTEEKIDVSFGLEDAGLTENVPHHVFSFWDSEYLGLYEEDVVIEDLKPHSCRLLAVKPSSSLPTVMSTSIHFTQGATELSNLEWSSDGKELSIRVKSDTKSRESVSFVFNNDWTPTKAFINDVETDIENIAPEVISVRERFKSGDVIRIRFER